MLLNLFINVELLLLLGLFQWTKVGKFLWKINHKFILVFPLQIKITRLLLKFMIFDLYLSHMCLGYWLLMILTKLFISFFLQYIEFLNVNNNTNMIINNKTTEYSFKILCPLNYIPLGICKYYLKSFSLYGYDTNFIHRLICFRLFINFRDLFFPFWLIFKIMQNIYMGLKWKRGLPS